MVAARERGHLWPAVRELPRTFGEYTLVERLGVGGTASVYLGRKRLHDGFEWVALKCLHPHLIEAGEIAHMFLHEAELLSRLHHPNVCEILRYGSEDGIPFLATRYLKGAPLDVLSKRLRGRALPVGLMAWIVAEACAGLHHAHEACNEDGAHLGIVHRDVSPQNIFVTFDGKVQLLDFGIAHAAIDTRSEEPGELRGKDGYMSPEQIRGASLDRRSDVFSIGIVLWEAITGRRLFDRSNPLATALAISEEPAPEARSANPNVSRQLSAIARRALSIDPNKRFATAREMEAMLRAEIGDDLSPQIQLQVLAREVLDADARDSETALDLRTASDDFLDDDDDMGDLTEIARPFEPPRRDLDESETTIEPVRPEDTVSIPQRPAALEAQVATRVTPPPPRTPGWRAALLLVLLALISLMVGFWWYDR